MGINRTFMELKLTGVTVLVFLSLRINRTFMELKQWSFPLSLVLRRSINRTFMELKRYYTFASDDGKEY